MEKARAIKQANDAKRRKESLVKIDKVDKILKDETKTITQACREVGISVDKFYRIKKTLRS